MKAGRRDIDPAPSTEVGQVVIIWEWDGAPIRTRLRTLSVCFLIVYRESGNVLETRSVSYDRKTSWRMFARDVQVVVAPVSAHAEDPSFFPLEPRLGSGSS